MLTKLAMHYSWSVRDNPNSICQAWIIFCRRSPSTDCFRFILMLAVCTLQLGETLFEVCSFLIFMQLGLSILRLEYNLDTYVKFEDTCPFNLHPEK